MIVRKVSDCGPTYAKQLAVFLNSERDTFPEAESDVLVMNSPGRVAQCIRNKGRLVK